VGRASAAVGVLRPRLRCDPPGRKVRAPQNTVVDNIHRPRGPGKCHRKQTADGPPQEGSGKGETVR